MWLPSPPFSYRQTAPHRTTCRRVIAGSDRAHASKYLDFPLMSCSGAFFCQLHLSRRGVSITAIENTAHFRCHQHRAFSTPSARTKCGGDHGQTNSCHRRCRLCRIYGPILILDEPTSSVDTAEELRRPFPDGPRRPSQNDLPRRERVQ